MVLCADNVELAQLLLEAGAKPDAQNAHGQTALDVATSLDELERSSPWFEVFDTSQWLVHVGNRPTGRARLIVVRAACTKGAATDPGPWRIQRPSRRAWLIFRPAGFRRLQALSEVMGVTPSAAVVEAAEAAARALSQASLPAVAGKADGDDAMAVDGALEANSEAGGEAAAIALQEEAVVEETAPAEAQGGQASD